jgi:hypothetical protein
MMFINIFEMPKIFMRVTPMLYCVNSGYPQEGWQRKARSTRGLAAYSPARADRSEAEAASGLPKIYLLAFSIMGQEYIKT